MFAYTVTASPRQAVALRHRRRSSISPGRLGDWIGRVLHNHATRRHLADTDDRTLADLGISRAQAQFESSRWMWD